MFASADAASNGLESDSNVGGVAAMVSGLTQNNKVLEDHVGEWLTSTNGDYATIGLDTRRAVIATLATHQGMCPDAFRAMLTIPTEKLQRILEKCLENFGDKLQIQHSPIVQQESK